MMNKSLKTIICLSLITALFLPLTTVKATTLQDYKNKVAELERNQERTNRLTQEASNKIDAKRNAIANANNTIKDNEQKVEEAKAKVTESEQDIVRKTAELEDVIATLQYTHASTESIYLDYVFDAESISDLIEREAIIEQISEDTSEQLTELEKLIVENQNLQVKLADDNVALTQSISTYEKQIEELDEYINQQAKIGLDYGEQLKAQKGLVKLYEDAGCKPQDDIDICYYAKYGGSGAFSRPLNKGKVTQAWNATHGGIDLGGNTPGTPVYAPATGTVIYVARQNSCGGNIVYMHALVNGQKYTVEMAHLRSINVSTGQHVTKGTQIGTVGGDSSTWWYDKCTSGPHLHYAISYGYYFTETSRTGWSTFKENTKATANQQITGIRSVKGWTWSGRG